MTSVFLSWAGTPPRTRCRRASRSGASSSPRAASTTAGPRAPVRTEGLIVTRTSTLSLTLSLTLTLTLTLSLTLTLGLSASVLSGALAYFYYAWLDRTIRAPREP